MDFSRRTLLSAVPLLTGALPAISATPGLEPDASRDQTRALQKALDKAMEDGRPLVLPPGRFTVSGLKITGPVTIAGTTGQTILAGSTSLPILSVENAPNVSLTGIAFVGGADTMVEASDSTLHITGCEFKDGPGSGLSMESCAGRITGNRFGHINQTALFSNNSRGMQISGNHVHDIGDNGIQVWTSDRREDGSIVSGNRIERIGAKSGGTGQNGNGINIYRAGNVLVSGNRITDCAFSAIRNNSGWNCQIIGNSVSRMGEVAIYVEFAFQGAVVSNNLIEDVSMGISITNFDVEGRLAVCSNNIVRNAKGGGSLPERTACGIHAEADTAITGNVVENAGSVGISLGWGRYGRNLSATGNIIRACGKGLTVSVNPATGPALIANNMISGSVIAAIMGMDHDEEATGDLGLAGAIVPARLTLSGNLIT